MVAAVSFNAAATSNIDARRIVSTLRTLDTGMLRGVFFAASIAGERCLPFVPSHKSILQATGLIDEHGRMDSETADIIKSAVAVSGGGDPRVRSEDELKARLDLN